MAKIQLVLQGHSASGKAMEDLLGAKTVMDGKWQAT